MTCPSAGETRFATNYIMLHRLVQLKVPLQAMVVSEDWADWARKATVKEKAGKVRTTILRDSFWEAAEVWNCSIFLCTFAALR